LSATLELKVKIEDKNGKRFLQANGVWSSQLRGFWFIII